MNKELFLQSSYCNLTGPLCFYYGQGVMNKAEKSEDGLRKLEKLKEEVLSTDHISVVARRPGKNEQIYYIMMTSNTAFNVSFNSEHNNFQITYVYSEREFIENKRRLYAYSSYIMYLNEIYGVTIIEINQSNVQSTSVNAERKLMEKEEYDYLCNQINFFFDNRTSDEDGFRISKKMRNLVDKINIINDSEYKYEEEQSRKDNYIQYYKRSSAKKNENNRNSYLFYSSSFNPDSEYFKEETHVEIETTENIKSDEKKKVTGVVNNRYISDDGDTIFEIELYNQIDDKEIPKEGMVYLQVNKKQSRIRKDVVEKIKRGQLKSEYMYDFFENFSAENFEEVDDWNEYEAELNKLKYPPTKSQMEAIKNGIETKDIELVLGPPGTGKTTVIVKWIEYFIKHDKKLLISSQNNAAVDNVLAQLKNNKDARVIRIGNNRSKIQGDCLEFTIEDQADKAANNYIEKLSQSNGYLTVDIIKLQLLQKKANEFYKILINNEELINKRNQYQNKFNEIRRTLITCKNKINNTKELLNNYKEDFYKKCLALREANKKNIIWKFVNRKQIAIMNENIFSAKAKVIENIQIHKNAIIEYNEKTKLLKEALLDNEYIKFKESYSEYLDEIKDFDFNVSLSGPIEAPVFDSNIYKSPYFLQLNQIANYIDKVIKTKNKLFSIKEALDKWSNDVINKRNEVLPKLLIQNANVVGATCIGINSNTLTQDMDFDISIIDESGQIQIQNVIVPMSKSPKTLMLGDHKQIPPMAEKDVCEIISSEDVVNKFYKQSFFQYMFESMEEKNKETKNIVRLNEQFRMPGDISNVIADWFYEGNYHSRYNMDNWSPIVKGTEKPLIMISTSNEKDRFDLNKVGKGNKIEHSVIIEAVTTASIVKNVLDNNEKVSTKDFGIISAYSAQVVLIRKEIKKLCKDRVADEECEGNIINLQDAVASLDSFQGQERSLIIYNMTRSNKKEFEIGFLKELRRLNVAFTRCKKQLIIIGNFDYLTSCKPEGTENMSMDEIEKTFDDNQKFSLFMSKMIDQTKKLGEYYTVEEFNKKIGIEK